MGAFDAQREGRPGTKPELNPEQARIGRTALGGLVDVDAAMATANAAAEAYGQSLKRGH